MARFGALRRLAVAAAVPTAGCAPVLGFRPATGVLPGRSGEVGAAAVAVSGHPRLDEPMQGAGQIWGTRSEGAVAVTLLGAFDLDAVGLGVAVRADLVRGDRFALGVEGEVGYPWLALSVPVAVRAFGASAVYSAPRLGNFGAEPALTIPLGFSLHAGDGAFVRAEGAAVTTDLALRTVWWAAGAGAAYQPPGG